MVKELRLETRARNNVLWRAIHEQYKSVAELCRARGFSQSAVGALLNLKTLPKTKKGEYKELAQQLSDLFFMEPKELFPDWIYGIKSPRVVKEISLSQLPYFQHRQLQLPCPTIELSRIEALSTLRKALSILHPREEQILQMRFGIDQPPKTLEQSGKILKLTRERVRQIEIRALKKLRNHLQEKPELAETLLDILI